MLGGHPPTQRGGSFVFRAQPKGNAVKRLSCTPAWESHGPLSLTALDLSAGLRGNWSLRLGQVWDAVGFRLYLKKCVFIWLHWVLVASCRIQFPNQRSNPGLPALGMWNLSHWITREASRLALRIVNEYEKLQKRNFTLNDTNCFLNFQFLTRIALRVLRCSLS